MEIKVIPEDIDNMVREAILKSAIGDEVNKAIKKALESSLGGWNSPIEAEVKKAIAIAIQEYLNLPENKNQLIEAINRYFTPDFISKILIYGIKEFKKDMDNYNDLSN